MSEPSSARPPKLETLYNVQSVAHFEHILAHNPGLVVIKVGAAWCPPCQAVRPLVHNWFARLSLESAAVQAVEVDADASPAFYAFLKRKRVVNGIPAILCYAADNAHHVPDDMVVGAAPFEVNAFFERCLRMLKTT